MGRGLQNQGLLKVGLVLSLIAQLLVALICLILAAGASTLPFIGSIAATPLWVVFAIWLLVVALTSASIHNVNNAKKSQGKYSRGLAMFAGIVALFTAGILGGILILIGAMFATESFANESIGREEIDYYEEDNRPFKRPSRDEYRRRRSSRTNTQDEQDYPRR